MVDQQNTEKKYIRGVLLHTIFKNEDENFSIIKIKIEDTNEDYQEDEIVAKGYFSQLQVETPYYFYGEFENHAKFGQQYRVNAYQTYIPDTKTGLITYLSSDLFYSVGEKTATKIVDTLGLNAINQIMSNPDCLNNVPGLPKKTAKLLYESLQEHQGFEHIAITLAKYELSLKMAQKIYQEYKEDSLALLEEDPYQFVFTIEGFGFHTADKIARTIGIEMTHPNRIGAGCIFILQQAMKDGHVFLPLEQCVQEVHRLLNIHLLDLDVITTILEELNKEKKVILLDGHVYLPSLYYAEDGFAAHLSRLMEKPVEQVTTLADLMKITGEIEETEILSYGKDQFHAIEQAIQSRMMILTGGPGTGKTTVIKGIVKAFATIHDLSLDIDDYDKKADFPFVLTAPTGRAAKRLSESTGLESFTIHRLLGWNGQDTFDKNKHNPLSGKLLIIDEFSMVDIWLAHSLFKAIPDDMQVLLVGDEDQLPSVGPGQVLSDLLLSKHIPVVRLQEVYRQKVGSKIIELAHEIKHDRLQIDMLNKANDFSFIEAYEPAIAQVVTTVYQKAIEKGYEQSDIQVLAPIYKTNAGINVLNLELQKMINPKSDQKREITIKDTTYRIGDRVIQLVNQPEDGIYNGDIGEIVAIFTAKENVEKKEQIVIAFDENEVVYERQDYQNIMLAYCISIHKSQGSEFPIVILPVVSSYYHMLRKNLLYTAITRSQNSLVICGDKNAFIGGVHAIDKSIRYTTLVERIENRVEKSEENLIHFNNKTKDRENSPSSPYDFM